MGKIAFIYPGQGAQKCFMGQDFYDTYENSAKAIVFFNTLLREKEKGMLSLLSMCHGDWPLSFKSGLFHAL